MTDNEALNTLTQEIKNLRTRLYGEKWDKGDIVEIKEAISAVHETYSKLIETTCTNHEQRISRSEGKMTILLILLSITVGLSLTGLLKAFEVWQ